MLHHRSAIALQEEKLRQAAGPTVRSRGVDDNRDRTQWLVASALNHPLTNTTLALLRKASGELIRRMSWSQAP
jgi:hypothetical protein